MRTAPPARGAQHRRELGVEQAALLERQPDRAQSERRVGGLGGDVAGQRLGQFVAADIERPQRYRLALHAAHQRREEFVLLVLARQVLAVHVEEFGAYQAESGRAVGHRVIEFDRQFEIGLKPDLDAVAS